MSNSSLEQDKAWYKKIFTEKERKEMLAIQEKYEKKIADFMLTPASETKH